MVWRSIELDEKIVKFSNGLRVINCTPHACTFQDGEELISVPASGVLVNSRIENEMIREFDKFKGGVKLVRPTFTQEEEALEFLCEFENYYPGVFVIGSIIAAQAYPNRSVVAMVSVEGFERVPPEQKRMRTDMFTMY